VCIEGRELRSSSGDRLNSRTLNDSKFHLRVVESLYTVATRVIVYHLFCSIIYPTFTLSFVLVLTLMITPCMAKISDVCALNKFHSDSKGKPPEILYGNYERLPVKEQSRELRLRRW
jgi:hypothetical protein